MAAALAIYVLSGDLAWIPNGHRQSAMRRVLRIESGLACRTNPAILRGAERLHSQKHLLKIEAFDGERWA